MANVRGVCSVGTYGNLGSLCSKGGDLGVPQKIIITTGNFSFPSFADFADKTKYDEAIKDKSMFPSPLIWEIEDKTEEDAFAESPLNGQKKLSSVGKYGYTFMFDSNLAQHIELQKFTASDSRYFIIDSKGKIRGTTPDGVKVQGYKLSSIDAGKQKMVVAKDGVSLSPLTITEEDPTEWNSHGIVVEPTWNVNDVEGLTNVDLEIIGTPTSTEIIVSVKAITGELDGAGAKLGVSILGLESSDFILKTTSGSSQTISTATDNDDGTYTLDGSAWVTGLINLVAPSAMTTGTDPIESTGAVVVTI